MRNKKLCSLLCLCQSVNYILFEYHYVTAMYKWVLRLLSTSIFVWTKAGLWYRCSIHIGFTRLCIKVIASSDISAWVVDTFRKVAISKCSWYISRSLDLHHLHRLFDFMIHRVHILREEIGLFWRDYIQICFTAAIWKSFKGFITRLIFMFLVRSKGFLFGGFDFLLISITIMKRTIKITAPTPASR